MNSTKPAIQNGAGGRPSLASAHDRDVLCKVREGVVTYVSPNAMDVSGLPPEAFLGRRMTELVHPDDVETLQRFLTPGWAGEIEATVRIMSARGGWLERDARGVREIDEHGTHSAVFVLRDLAERQRADEAVTRIEARSHALLTAMPDLMFHLSREGCYLDFKPARAEEFVVPQDKIIGGYVREHMEPELAERVMDAIRKALDEGGVHTLEYSLTKPTGVREIEGRFVACGNDEVLVISRDITDRRRIERALIESEQKYRNLVEGARDVVYTIDLQGNFTTANDVVTAVFGYRPEEIIGMNLAEVVDPIHVPYLLENAEFAMRGERIGQPIEFLTYAKDGSPRWVEVVATPIRTDGGVTGFQGIARDIGERKRAEERLQFQAQLLDAISQAVFFVDADGKIALWNKYSEQLYGRTAEEMVGRPVTDLKPADDRPDAVEAYHHVLRGEHWMGEVTARARDGSAFPSLVAIGPIHDAQGARTGVACMTAEISALKRAQQQAQSAHEQAALSEERARIAQELHDSVAQYFFGIGMAAKELAERPSVSPTLMKRKLGQMRRLSAQGGREVRNATRTLAPFEETAPLAVAVLPLLEDVRAFGLDVSYDERCPATPPAAVNSLLYAIARELLFNVRKHAQATQARVRLTGSARRVTLTVSDNGIGRADVIRRSMEGGTGFGLRSLHRRLNQRGGTMVATDCRAGGVRIVCAMPLGGD